MKQHNRHAPFYFATLSGIAIGAFFLWLSPGFAITAGANAFFLTYLAMSAVRMRHFNARYLRRYAAGEDLPAWVFFSVTLATVIVATVSLFLIINAKAAYGGLELGLSLASVVMGWATLHTTFALHYAHEYWEARHALKSGENTSTAGFDFPQTADPSGYDFLYFAFTMGMTAQTSDVAVTSTPMRKLALAHGVTSFLFNTVLIAAAVNLAVSLGQ